MRSLLKLAIPAALAAVALQAGGAAAASPTTPHAPVSGVSAGCTVSAQGASAAVHVRVCQTLPSAVRTPAPAPSPSASCPVPKVDDHCALWSQTFAGPGLDDQPGGDFFMSHVMATSPDGKTVYVAEASDHDTTTASYAYDIVTIAYRAADGTQRWLARQPGTATYIGVLPYAIAVTSSEVLVTGDITLAYSATTGRLLWQSSLSGYDGVASPDGSLFYVTGWREVSLGNGLYRIDAVVTALSATTGATVWQQILPGVAGHIVSGQNIGNPDFGMRLAVGGTSLYAAASRLDATGYTIGVDVGRYDLSSGVQLARVHLSDFGYPVAGIVASRDGTRAYVAAGYFDQYGSPANRVLVAAIDGVRGEVSWLDLYTYLSPSGQRQELYPYFTDPIVLGPNGSTLYVAAEQFSGPDAGAVVTSAFSTASGSLRWASEYITPNVSVCICGPVLTVAPSGGRVFMAFMSYDSIATSFTSTVAYNTGSGAQQWVGVDTLAGSSFASAIAVDPQSSRVFTAGAYALTGSSSRDGLTIAYSAT